jgi:hypothetical protein
MNHGIETESEGRKAQLIVAGRLIRRGNGEPVYPALIEAWDTRIGKNALATAKADRAGAFLLTIGAQRTIAAKEVALYVFDAEHETLLVGKPTRLRLDGKAHRDIIIHVDAPILRQPVPSDLSGVRKALGLKVPRSLSRFLDEANVKTLTDLRQQGDLAKDPALPVAADDPAFVTLESLAALSLLPTDVATNAALVSAGMHDVLDVAAASPAALQAALQDTPSSTPLALIRSVAQDQVSALSNLIVDVRMQAAFGERPDLPKPFQDALPQVCSCSDCQNALSPIAYLVDLLNYAIGHLRNNGQVITLTFLQNRFHQPFRDLPASCAELNRKVRRARICIEILRQHLAPQVVTQYPAILEAAYRSLLENIGTSYEEIRQISRRGTPSQSTDLMARIMMPASVSLSTLLKDPNAASGDPMAVTEAWLAQTFGLRDTTLDPLAGAPDPLAATPAQFPDVLRWQRRFLWDAWSAADYAATSPTLDGRPLIDPDVIGRPDLIDVTSNPTPRAARPDRTQWSVLDFLEDRQNWIDVTTADLRANTAGAAAGLQARITNLLQQLQRPATSFPQVVHTGMEGLTFAAVSALYKRLQIGDSIADELQQLDVTADELEALGRVVDLAVAGDPILTSEWDDFDAVIVGRVKRVGFYPVWKDEERQMRVTLDGTALTGLTLSPFHFQPRTGSLLASDTPWAAKRWRSTDADRGRWDQLLASRTDQLSNIVTVLQGAVDVAEITELPEIRNLLLGAAQLPGVTLLESIRRLTERYQIDFQDGGCAITTRIAQAIETLQDVLFDVRNGLIDDPALTIEDDDFDGIWQWLGSYATWKAAMQVVLYPEVALRPTLRSRQSPGFMDFIAYLRSAGQLAPASARSAVAVYEQYFVDVCNLGDGVCTLAPAPGPAGNGQYNYLFSKSTSGRVYWCYFDLSDEQSYWRQLDLPEFESSNGDLTLFGAAYLTGSAGECFLYVFAKRADVDEDRIVFARTDLRQHADWTMLIWDVGALKPLPAGASRFQLASVLTNRAATDPVHLSVWLSGTDAYVRALNQDGTAWDTSADYFRVPATGAWRRLGTNSARNNSDFACSTQQIAPKFILAGDFDQDGQDEIAIIPNRAGTQGNDIWMMKYDAATKMWNHMSPISGHPFDADLDVGAVSPPAKFAVAGDFDGDGYPEIAIAADMSGGAAGNMDDVGFWVRKFNRSSGTWDAFGAPNTILPHGLSFGSDEDHWSWRLTTRYAVVGDFDGDNRDEIAVAVTPVEFVEFPIKFNSNAFLCFDLELGSAGNHTWRHMQDLLCDAKVDSPLLHPYDSPYSRFAVAGKFHPGDNRALLLVGKKKLSSQNADEDPNLGNDFWVCRYDGNSWSTLDPSLDCGDVAVAALFGVVGDFDGDGNPEVALAQEATLPGDASFGFWIEKMDETGNWAPLPDLKYGNRRALYAVAGDFDGNGADEIAVVTSDVLTSNVHVFAFGNGQWAELQAPNENILAAPGALATGLQPGQIPGDEFVVAGVSARLLPGDSPAAKQLVLLSRPDSDNTARAYAFGATITGQWSATCSEMEIKPAFSASSPVFATPDIATARLLNARVPAALGSRRRRSNRDYLEEMLYFVPIEIANRFRENGAYQSALDWCRLAYDYSAPAAQRIVSAKLLGNQSLSAGVYEGWLRDTLNPHAIAETRKNAYLKYTVWLICACLVDWADAEFSRADPESIPRARELYERALDLLNLPEIRQRSNDCGELLDTLAKTIGHGEVTYAFEPVFREIAAVRDPTMLANLSATIIGITRNGASLQKKVAESLAAVRASVEAQPAAPTYTFDELRHEASARLKSMARIVNADAARSPALQALGDARARVLNSDGDKRRKLNRFTPAPVLTFCIPANPATVQLRQHAELCLQKVRDCKNIAGLDLCLDPYGATTADLTGADAGNLRSTLASGLQPMPYHYATLIERTKQLVELSRQIESSMLQFISSADQAQYEELKARQDLELTQAGVQQKELQVIQATDGVASAKLQRDRAQLQASHFSGLLANGWTVNEQLQVANLAVASVHQHAAAIASWIGIWFGQSNVSTAIGTSGAAWAMNSQFHGLLASFERRNQEWQYDLALARQDVQTGELQITVAQDQLGVANQEQVIATLQADHARTLVDFLANKFLNADLYEWMASVLEQVYRFFLQQATQLARLAELQLAFERQEPPASIIKADYWERPTTDLTPDVGASTTGTNSVRGLTGSARLLRDVYELDQYAFAKNQRKQQLSETFSLAELDPFAFQVFRQSGRLPFATPMSLFDRRFPGHYLRLIKRVRVSVVALIPPTMGIRASLSSVGPTRVTIGPDVFRTVTIQRDPQLVAYTSPANATGLFDLDAQPELLVPFEGLGVDGQWVFELPLSANPFDFDAIADVLITFDYTSLYSPDYQQQVLATLDRRFSADRAFSFHDEFEDAWYYLNNPDLVDPPDAPMTVSFTTRRSDFPPHLSQLAIGQVLMQFVQKPQTKQALDVTALYYTTVAGQAVPAARSQRSASSDADGLISTRRGAWSGLIGGAIDDDLTWTLTLPATVKPRLQHEEITDIFFVISYTALV